MEKKLDIKYNIPAIKAFLNIFDLTLEDREYVVIGDILKVIGDNEEVGVVKFNDGDIEVKARSKYGIVKAQTNYADAFGLTDLESLDSIGMVGLYVSWFNNFMFSLDDKITGDLNFGVKLDNEFGNKVLPHFKLKYKDDDKEYIIKFQEEGLLFKFIESRDKYKEKIIYNLFDTMLTGSYLQHSKAYVISDNEVLKKCYEGTFISKGYYDKTKNSAIINKEINGKRVEYQYLEFERKGKDDEPEEIINKSKMFHLRDDTVNKKIKSLIEEFPFLEKVFLYAFTNYSDKEVYALFGLNKNSISLDKFYFDEEKVKFLVKS